MPSLHPNPGIEYYFKACRKGDPEAKAVPVNESAVRAIADLSSEITGLPRDMFDVHQISKAEFEAPRSDYEHLFGDSRATIHNISRGFFQADKASRSCLGS